MRTKLTKLVNKILGICECTSHDVYPHLSVMSCKNCGTITFTGGTVRYLR